MPITAHDCLPAAAFSRLGGLLIDPAQAIHPRRYGQLASPGSGCGVV
jgi:hypothetical protein